MSDYSLHHCCRVIQCVSINTVTLDAVSQSCIHYRKNPERPDLHLFYVCFFCVQATSPLLRPNLPDVPQGRVQWLGVINYVANIYTSLPGTTAESMVGVSCFDLMLLLVLRQLWACFGHLDTWQITNRQVNISTCREGHKVKV